jgi:hypothetical protein
MDTHLLIYSWEVSRTKGFENLKIRPQTRTKGSMKEN